MHGYNKWFVWQKQTKKSSLWKSKTLIKTEIIIYNTKLNPRKRMNFFSQITLKKTFQRPKRYIIKYNEAMQWQE